MNNQKKFSKIYDQYIDKIYRFVFLKVSSQETAEDLCSETFTRVWQSIDKGTKIENPQAFIYQIARNLVTDHYRQNSKAKLVSIDNCKEIEDNQPNLEEKSLLMSDINRVKLALNNIKPEYQDIIICHYLDDLSIPEIAEIMNKPKNSIRVTLHRGLKALKRELS
ncbi:sigma-70 family RNA polymerase sigma factor [Candidatus Parcubacteria bacterium]|nr:sigma-70 family RNA polymerase sigma factor [Candidatus Parcubacteria bacterium]